jgi:hypothetical protein
MKLPTIIAALVLGLTTIASALTIGGPRDLGLIDPNHPASISASAGFINTLLDRPLNSGPTVIGDNAYTRTGNDPLGGVYPDATAVGAVDLMSGVLTSIGTNFIVPTAGLTYLYVLAKYDGPNYGSVIFYTGDLTGNFIVPTTAGGYGLSHVTLFNPVPTPRDPGSDDPGTPVPDGGSTAIMLGAAMLGIGLIQRRKLASVPA